MMLPVPSRPSKRRRAPARLLGVCAAAVIALAPAVAQEGPLTPLTIETAGGRHEFQVEVAADDATRTRGLMYRQTLAPDRGMLFDFEAQRPISMWMKNTYVSLDMVFIRADGRVHRVEERTTPFSERTIDSGAPVRYVLEIAGGVASRIGIRRGDKVSSRIIAAGR